MAGFDPLIGSLYSHTHLAGEVIDLPNKFINVTGDTMTGDLVLYNNILHTKDYLFTIPKTGTPLIVGDNLSDLNNVATARTNLGLVAGGTGDIWVEKAGDTMSRQLFIDGTSDEIQLRIQGVAGQTANLFSVEDSTGYAPFYLYSNGRGYLQPVATAASQRGFQVDHYSSTVDGLLYALAFNMYVRNNGLTSGFSQSYGIQGGVSIQALAANSYNRNVYAVAGGVSLEASAGRTAATLTGCRAFLAISPATSGAGTITPGVFYGMQIQNQGSSLVTNSYGLYIDAQSGSTNNYAVLVNDGYVVFNEAGAGTPFSFRIEGDTATNLFKADYVNDAIQIGTTTAGVIADFRVTEIVFNESGLGTLNFRVESDTEDNMIFLDANGDTDGALYLGGSTNGIKINKGGEMTFIGTATAWDDLRVTPAGFDRAGIADPSLVSYTPTGSSIATYLYEFQVDDIAYFTVQLPHSYKEGSDIKVHVHWTPGLRGNEENGATVGWKIDYAWANINGTFGAMSTADCSDACDGTDDKHQMTPEVTITGTSKTKSSMLICNIKRTDTGTDDTWAGTASGQLPLLLEIDFHYEIDKIGSST